ncbi:MAG: 50S ribosomal protein L24 [Candidatus Paceibacterota bacterium]|jgi:large subunit ribosomal protein L24
MYVKKDDMVIVLSGKDKGKKGKILRVFRELDKVTVEGVAVRKKTLKAKRKGQKGQIIEKAVPIHVSNVALIDPKTDRPTRIGSKIVAKKKVRITKKSGMEI